MYSEAWAGQSKYCGTTAVSVLIDADRVAHVVNVGDSRAVLCRGGAPLRLSFDHKPYSDEEQGRIRGLGGCVAGETGRVNGLLAVSRSIGDFYMHPFVTDEPFQAQVQLEEADEKLILACDGVWDEVSDERAVEIVMAEADPFLACAKLRDFAYALGSDDNISVMILHLKEQ
jgi:serine/threonine protein phosphatase PrpC